MMLRSSTAAQAASHRASSSRTFGPSVCGRPASSSTVCKASETETQQTTQAATIPQTKQEASGFVAFDTAGQANMYPVITRAYEAGSQQDTLETGSANLVVGVGAAAIAVGVLALGLVALSTQGGSGADTAEQYKSLGEYAAAFAAEL